MGFPPFEFIRPPGDDNRHPAYCDEYPRCQWENWFATEMDATVAGVLHMLKRHPDEYATKTGNDPERKLYEYREQLQLFTRYI